MSYDELELDKLGDRKTALFFISRYGHNLQLFGCHRFTRSFSTFLCDKADDTYGGRLPVHVRCLADEFANIGQIPQFEKLIATIRSREISASIILQSQTQLKAMYKDNADTILGNCDTTLFLGGKEKTTLKKYGNFWVRKPLICITLRKRGAISKSFGLNYQKTGKQLMTQDEIAVMDGGKCILQLRGCDHSFRTNSTSRSTRTINICPTQTRKTPLTWRSTYAAAPLS